MTEPSAQESRTEQVSFRVTAAQKSDVRFLAAALGVSEGELLHSAAMPAISERAAIYRAKLAEVEADEAVA